MPPKPPDPAEINKQNRAFWTKLQKAMDDQVLIEHAIGQVDDARTRGVPEEKRQSIEAAVQSASALVSAMACRAAKSPRPHDPLQALIIEIVTADQAVSAVKLLRELRRQSGGGVINFVDDDSIQFWGNKGEMMAAPISGLKDRLTRALKKIRSR